MTAPVSTTKLIFEPNKLFGFWSFLKGWTLGGHSFVLDTSVFPLLWCWLTCWTYKASCLLKYSKRSSVIFPRWPVSRSVWDTITGLMESSDTQIDLCQTISSLTSMRLASDISWFWYNDGCLVMLGDDINLLSISGLDFLYQLSMASFIFFMVLWL